MANDKRRARSIAQAQKQRQQAKAASPSPTSSPRPDGGGAPPAAGRPKGPDRGRPSAGAAVKKASSGNLERKLTIRLDAERYAQLEAYARREGFTASLVLRHLLCRFLDDQGRFPGVGGL